MNLSGNEFIGANIGIGVTDYFVQIWCSHGQNVPGIHTWRNIRQMKIFGIAFFGNIEFGVFIEDAVGYMPGKFIS